MSDLLFPSAQPLITMACQFQKFVEQTFATPGSAPEFLIYDNNCNLKKHVRDVPFFDNIALPVDVFHFKCKHKETDTFCQLHCNPASFPELLDGEKWRFNTSIAEQTNAWFGGYLSMCREMGADRYDLFLDEMIRMRNELIVEKLEKSNLLPHFARYD